MTRWLPSSTPDPELGEPLTMFDPDLALNPMVTVAPRGAFSIDERFRLFHEANPHVYHALVRMTRDLVDAGRSRVGIGMLFEVLRWQYLLRTTGDDFKLNNNFRSRYARLIVERNPDLAGVFELRELKTP